MIIFNHNQLLYDERIVHELMLLLPFQHVLQHLQVHVQDDEHVLILKIEKFEFLFLRKFFVNNLVQLMIQRFQFVIYKHAFYH